MSKLDDVRSRLIRAIVKRNEQRCVLQRLNDNARAELKTAQEVFDEQIMSKLEEEANKDWLALAARYGAWGRSTPCLRMRATQEMLARGATVIFISMERAPTHIEEVIDKNLR